RGLSSRTTPRGRESGEWREPATSREDSEASGGVARQSEGSAQLPVLPAIRQGVPRGRAGLRLSTLPSQRRGRGCGRRKLRGHRGVRHREGGEREGGRTQAEAISPAGSTPGAPPE